jgi:hypothetical protein
MSRLFLLLLATAVPLVAQAPASHPSAPAPGSAEHKRLDEVDALQSRARQILKAELSRKLDPACDPEKLSNAEFGNCFEADEAITERNYRAFVDALKASLAIEPPEVPVKGLPLPSKNFGAGEVAWRTYVDKTCTALGDTEYGASGIPTDMAACQKRLTRQHMTDLKDIFLAHYNVEL